MRQITERQMHRLEADWDARCAARIADLLGRRLPQRFEGLPAGQRQAFAAACIRHARGRQLRHEADLARYAVLAAFLGIDFERHPAAARCGLQWLEDEAAGPAWLQRAGERLVRLMQEGEDR